MIGNYLIATPSLEGILAHPAVEYDGLKRPLEVLQMFEGPASRGRRSDGIDSRPSQRKALEGYFDDLYRVFMKRLSFFVVGAEAEQEDAVKLQAMLQEMIKIKSFMSKSF